MPNDVLTRRSLLGLVFSLLFLPLLALPGLAQPTSDQARSLVEGIGAQVLTILRNDELVRQQKFERLVDVLEGPIDLGLVGRLILGRHWRTASEEQRQEYLQLFRAFALDALASRLHAYQGQEFAVTGAQVVGDRDAMVASRILSDGRPPLNVNWRLREVDGELVAIDVIVEGVSLIVTQRSEFGSVVERQGVEGLLGALRQRVNA